MQKIVFLYSGEGTHSSDTRFKLLQNSPLWEESREILQSKLNLNLEALWQQEIHHHRCPASPLITLISQICLADLWRTWGYAPDAVIGHSTGELAAAYEAGFYSLEKIILIAHNIGMAAAGLEGEMHHGWLNESELAQAPVNISSVNFKDQDERHVTISGYGDALANFLEKHPDFIKMKLPHPWHHPDYKAYADQITPVASGQIEKDRFVSGITGRFETRLADDHWRNWLVSPVNFIRSMQAVRDRCGEGPVSIIEIGFHPVLAKSCEVFDDYTYLSSMFRGEEDIKYIIYQRGKLDPAPLLRNIRTAVDAFRPQLEFDTPLAYQAFTSLDFVKLATVLRPYFPSLAPQDFYRYKTIDQLIDGFGRPGKTTVAAARNFQRNEVVIAGMSCRLPSAVETLPQFWEMLTSRKDQVRQTHGRGGSEAGFLDTAVTRFDHQFFNISQAEARTMDPQQILALELTEMLWRDAGIDPAALDRQRVGVYIGAWNQEYGGDPSSVYYPTGTNPSIIASRISYHYDLRGPSWVGNTACSSSLVAIHYAVKDIEAGRVDYAVAGGVNMLLDQAYTDNMRNSGFLSADNRCKTFDDGANGYVRAEGGGLVLLVNKDLADKFYAKVLGSAINQNGGRAQVITAPHPEAQEELITTACRDAGIVPQEIAYLECHGTGTKIGDPIEMAAIQNTVARERGDTLYVGSVKSNLGHLESAAGIAGVIKGAVALNHGVIPPNLHFETPNQFIDFKSHPITVVAKETPIETQAKIGISSFGFGGANAHIIIQGAEDSVRKEILPLEVPFNRDRAVSLDTYLRLTETRREEVPTAEPITAGTESEVAVEASDIFKVVQEHLFKVTGVEEIDPDVALLDQGLDSMSATELFHHLQEAFRIELDIEVLFDNPLLDQFVAAIEKMVPRSPQPSKEDGTSRDSIDALLKELFYQLTGIEEIDPEIELTEQGLDSMSGAEMISQLENRFKIEIGPEVLFDYPLRDQFVDRIHAMITSQPN